MATLLPGAPDSEETEARSWLPALSARNGALAIEHGMHQELGWDRRTDRTGIAVRVFDDRIDNPVLEAASRFAAGDSEAATVLLDPPVACSTPPDRASPPPESRPASSAACLEAIMPASATNGDALAVPTLPQSLSLAQALAGVHPRRAQAYSLSLSGTLEAPEPAGAPATAGSRRIPSLWLPPSLRTQPRPGSICTFTSPSILRRGSFEAILDLRNMLAEGYALIY